MKRSIPYKASLMNILIVLIIVVEILFITQPNLSTIANIKKDIQSQYAEVNRQLSLGQTTKKLLQDLELIEPYLEKISTFFLSKEDQLAFITTLESISAENNMTVDIQLADIPETSDSSEDIFTIPLSLTLKGSYPDTVQFLVTLQSLNFYTNITNLSMNSTKRAGRSPVITTSLRANTYWKK